MRINQICWKIVATVFGAGIVLNSRVSAMPPPPEGVDILALSSDGRIVAASGRGLGGGIKVWNVQQRFSYPGVTETGWRYVGFSPDGRLLQATNSKLTRSWEITTGKEQPYQYGGLDPYFAFTVSQDWKHIAQVVSTGVNNPSYELKIQHTGKISLLVPYAEPNSSLSFSLDGRLLAYAGYIPPSDDLPANSSKDLSLRIFDTRTGDVLQSISLGQTKHPQASFTDDGKYVAVAFADGKVTLFNATTAREEKSFVIPPHGTKTDWSRLFYFSSDGETLVSLNSDIQLWNVRQGTLQTTLNLPKNPWIRAIAFSADRKTFAAGVYLPHYEVKSTEPMVYVWNVESSQIIATFR